MDTVLYKLFIIINYYYDTVFYKLFIIIYYYYYTNAVHNMHNINLLPIWNITAYYRFITNCLSINYPINNNHTTAL